MLAISANPAITPEQNRPIVVPASDEDGNLDVVVNVDRRCERRRLLRRLRRCLLTPIFKNYFFAVTNAIRKYSWTLAIVN